MCHTSSGGSHSYTCTPCTGVVQVGNNNSIESRGIGTVMVKTVVHEGKHWVMLHNVIYAPDIMHKLISVSRMHKNRTRVTIDSDGSGRGQMQLMHNPTRVVSMTGVKTSKGLYQAVMRVHTSHQSYTAESLTKCL